MGDTWLVKNQPKPENKARSLRRSSQSWLPEVHAAQNHHLMTSARAHKSARRPEVHHQAGPFLFISLLTVAKDDCFKLSELILTFVEEILSSRQPHWKWLKLLEHAQDPTASCYSQPNMVRRICSLLSRTTNDRIRRPGSRGPRTPCKGPQSSESYQLPTEKLPIIIHEWRRTQQKTVQENSQ